MFAARTRTQAAMRQPGFLKLPLELRQMVYKELIAPEIAILRKARLPASPTTSLSQPSDTR